MLCPDTQIGMKVDMLESTSEPDPELDWEPECDLTLERDPVYELEFDMDAVN